MKGRARLQVLTAALLFSTAGAAIKGMAFTSWQVASFRSGIAATALLLLLPGARRKWTRNTLLAAIAYGATMVLFVSATKLTTAANAIFLQAAGPLYLVFLGPWLLKERANRRDLVFLAVMAVGMSLFFAGNEAPQRTAPNPAAGNILAALSGIAWALTVAGLRAGARGGDGSLGMVALGNVLTFAFCLVPALSSPLKAGAVDWATITYMGVFQIGLAYTLVARASSYLPALETSLLVLLEPALNPVWTWLVHGEEPGPLAIAGGICIIASTVGMVITGRNDK
jgi:drug/metabolite transporter (DMT)-like permease